MMKAATLFAQRVECNTSGTRAYVITVFVEGRGTISQWRPFEIVIGIGGVSDIKSQKVRPISQPLDGGVSLSPCARFDSRWETVGRFLPREGISSAPF